MSRGDGARTHNLAIKSRLRYQLRHSPFWFVLHRGRLEPTAGIEPAFSAWKAETLAIELRRRVDAVRPERFELPFPWFEATCSIRLCYERKKNDDGVGSRGQIRTDDLRLIRAALSPTELHDCVRRGRRGSRTPGFLFVREVLFQLSYTPMKNGSEGRARTFNLRIQSPSLCQLRYLRMNCWYRRRGSNPQRLSTPNFKFVVSACSTTTAVGEVVKSEERVGFEPTVP